MAISGFVDIQPLILFHQFLYLARCTYLLAQ